MSPRPVRGARCIAPFAVISVVLIAVAVTQGCDSGLGHDPRLKNLIATADEAVPESLNRFGFDLGLALRDPGTGMPAPAREMAVEGRSIGGLGSTLFLAFTTAAAADNADGTGADLDRSAPAPADANNNDDVFLAALSQGAVRDVVLVSRAAGGAAAANGLSGEASLAFEVNPAFVPGNPPTNNPAGWVHVAFVSTASNIVGVDGNAGGNDVFRASIAVDVVAGPNNTTTLDLRREEAGGPDPEHFPQYVSAANGIDGNTGGGTGVATEPVIADNGDLVAFTSTDGNLVAGDSNGRRDVFLRAPRSDFTARVTSGNGDSDHPTVTDDVVPVLAFESAASNLVAGDTNARRDLFFAALLVSPGPPASLAIDPLKRASVRTGDLEANGGDSRRPAVHVITADVDGSNGPDGIDNDGRFDQVQIAFESDSTDIVAARPAPSTTNVYLYDNRAGGRTILLNQRVGPGGATLGSAGGGASPCDSFNPTFQPSGAAVAFETLADNLDTFQPSDQNQAKDVVLVDVRQAFVSGALRVHRLSVPNAGGDADGASSNPVFASVGGAGGAGGGVTPYFSQALAGFMTADRCAGCHVFYNDPSKRPPGHSAYSDNGACNACHTPVGVGLDIDDWGAPPAALDFRNKTADELCAQVRDTPNDQGSASDHLKHDGRILWALLDGFNSHCGDRTTLSEQFGITQTDWNALVDAWVGNGFQCRPFGSAGGDVVLFDTAATNLGTAANDSHLIGFPESVALERASKTSGFPPTGGKQASRAAFSSSITRDDRFVAFATSSALDAARDGNQSLDVYVRDLLLGTTTLVSHGLNSSLAAAGSSTRPSAAVDAAGVLCVAFESTAGNLVNGFVDGNGAGSDVYLADFSTFNGSDPMTIQITLLSARTGVPARGGSGSSTRSTLAVGVMGPVVGFESLATDLVAGFVDHNGATSGDVFVDEVASSGVRLASARLASAVDGGNGASSEPALSDDGLFLAFTSTATDLVSGFVDHAGAAGSDVFLRDLALDATSLGSMQNGSLGNDGGNGSSSRPALNGNGRVLAFQSLASDLMIGFVDGNGATLPDVFVVDFTFATVDLASESTGGPGRGGDLGSHAPSLSPDGNAVAFDSDATDLLAGDGNGDSDVYLRDRGANSTRRLSLALSGTEPRGDSTAPHFGSDLGQIVFESLSDNLVGANVDTNGVNDVYRARR